MNFFTTWRRYQSLLPDQKLFLNAKEIQGSRVRTDWIGFIAPMAEVDRGLDSARKFLGWTSGLLIAVAIIGAFAFESLLPLLLLPISGALFYIWSQFKSLDLPASPGTFLLPLLALLQEETVPETAIFLKLDLRGYERGNKVVRNSGTADDKLTFYKDAWVASTFLLGDGSRLQWEISDIVRSRTRHRRSRSGKIKVKTKVKVRRTIEVRLRVKAKDYRLDATEPIAAGPETPSLDLRVKVKPGEKRNDIRIRKRYAPLTPDSPPMPADLVDAVVEAYRLLAKPEGAT